MSYKIISIPFFDRQFKRLARKFPSLKSDFQDLVSSLIDNPTQGDSLGKSSYKIRLSISSKRKGKSGGARVITHVHITGETVYLLNIYDKSEQSSIANNDMLSLIKEIKK